MPFELYTEEKLKSLGFEPTGLIGPAAAEVTPKQIETIVPSAVAITPLEGALRMARLGVRVAWVTAKKKYPPMNDFPNLATTDEMQISKWAAERPNCNWLALATPDTVCFIDEDQSAALHALYEEKFRQPFPLTRTTESQKDHKQSCWLQTDRTRAFGNRVQGDFRNGMLSFRQRNEYCLVEGSIHPITNLPYKSNDAPIIEMPDTVMDLLESLIVIKRVVDASPMGEKIPHHQHDDELTRIAGKLRHDGIEEQTMAAALTEICEKRCEGYGEDYVEMCEKIAHSICKKPAGKDETVFFGDRPAGSTAAVSPAPANEEVQPLVSVDGDMFMKEDIPPRKTLLRLKDSKNPIFTKQSINQIFAWRGLGKTCLGFGLTAAFATGGSLLNWEAPERCRVLYVEGELPAPQAQERWRQIIGETRGWARLITIDKQPHNTIPSLASAAGMAKIEKTLAQLESEGFETDVLILDSISTLFNIPANDEESWITIQSWLTSLRSRGLCIFFFHHAGKSGMSRSHSKSEDMLDISIKLSAPKEQDGGCLHVLMQYDKARAGFRDPDTEFKMRRVHGPNCVCRLNKSLVGCGGDGVEWSFKAPGELKRFEAEQRFARGMKSVAIANELDIVPSTVRNWRKKWSAKRKKQGIGIPMEASDVELPAEGPTGQTPESREAGVGIRAEAGAGSRGVGRSQVGGSKDAGCHRVHGCHAQIGRFPISCVPRSSQEVVLSKINSTCLVLIKRKLLFLQHVSHINVCCNV
jgi:hypothetical protein